MAESLAGRAVFLDLGGFSLAEAACSLPTGRSWFAAWLDILAATFQWFELPAFSGNLLKRVSNKPKGYFADTGIACAAQVVSSPAAVGGHPMWGALFETIAVGELRKQCGLMSPPPAMYHWRRYSGAEVDLLVERDGILFPVEVKAKSNLGRRDVSGITAFRKSYPHLQIAEGMVLAPCEKVLQLSENDYAVPWDIASVD